MLSRSVRFLLHALIILGVLAAALLVFSGVFDTTGIATRVAALFGLDGFPKLADSRLN